MDLTLGVRFGNAVAYNGTIYEFNGRQGGTEVTTVYYAPINTDGSIGTWNTTSSLNTPAESADVGVYDQFIYSIGGDNPPTQLNTVQYAPINNSGTLGTWVTSTYTLPLAVEYASSVINNGYIYIMGGCTSSCGDFTGSGSKYMFYAAFGSSGDLTTQANCPTGSGSSSDSNSVWCYNSTELPTAHRHLHLP